MRLINYIASKSFRIQSFSLVLELERWGLKESLRIFETIFVKLETSLETFQTHNLIQFLILELKSVCHLLLPKKVSKRVQQHSFQLENLYNDEQQFA